jgi:hypothetical protein
MTRIRRGSASHHCGLTYYCDGDGQGWGWPSVLIRHGGPDGGAVGRGDGVGHGVLWPFSAIRQPPGVGWPCGGTVGRGHGETFPAPSRMKQSPEVPGELLGEGVGHGEAWPPVPMRHPLCWGLGVPVVGGGHGTGEPPLVEIRHVCDAPGLGLAVGVGHGAGPFGPDTRQLAVGDGAALARGVGVGHGAAVAPLLTRHDGVGLGPATAPVTPPGVIAGSVELLTPPPPAQAAVSVTIAMIRPSRRIHGPRLRATRTKIN